MLSKESDQSIFVFSGLSFGADFSSSSGCFLVVILPSEIKSTVSVTNSAPYTVASISSDGSSITSFVSLDKVGATDTTMPWYKTYAAVHHDVKDVDDG
jgi:hypothetical protein